MSGPLAHREIVLAVTGSIAAYKACDIASRLVEAGATVTPVLSEAAQAFVGAASLEGITGRPVVTDLFSSNTNPAIEHIAVARRADLFLIAPATANTLAKAAQGIADDWLGASLLATRAPILFAPAMNTQMWLHPATQTNVETLRRRGCHFVGPGEGMLACRTVGPGRLADTPAILEAVEIALTVDKPLLGKHVLLTSGGNHEPIDPVRYIGNRSTGKMGRALAMAALARGARVTVISGPAETPLPCEAECVGVQTAQEMLDAVAQRLNDFDIFIGAAAVADYRVESPAVVKHKRGEEVFSLSLTPNPDIAAFVGTQRQDRQIAAGFAAETHALLEHGAEKLTRKGLDFIVANVVNVPDSGFGADTSRAWLLSQEEAPEELGLCSKRAVADRLLDACAALLDRRKSASVK